MTVSERLRSCWGPSRLAHHGDLRSEIIAVKQASQTTSATLRVKNKSFLYYPSQRVERKATSVTAAEFYGAVIPSDLYVPLNSAVVHL